MKKISAFLMLLAALSSKAQSTATNFTENDCAGISHTLFTELDSGKVVVLIWVMPCGACVSGAVTAQAEVQNALAANPGKVLFYLADDYGNSTCQSLNSWCSANGITDATVFSKSTIKMSDYGANGMPKLVVMAGPDHKVYYNQNAPSITASGVKNAIDAAILANSNTTGIAKNQAGNGLFKMFPNPSNGSALIQLNLDKDSKVKITVENQLGQKVADVYAGNLKAGPHTVRVNTAEFAAGTYFISFSAGNGTVKEKLVVGH